MTGHAMGHGHDSTARRERWRPGADTWRNVLYSVLYLAAIVAANLLTTWLGPWVTPINALVFIGWDITAKDKLQHRWGFGWKLAGLIGAGSLLSVMLCWGAWRIALASFVAFGVSGLADALVYERLRSRPWWVRVNGSNVASAILDSALFLWIAFGCPLPWVALLGQIVAKLAGGALWGWALYGARTGEGE